MSREVIRHVGLIKIQNKEFDFTPIRLRSVRPFVFEEISLYAYHDQQTEDKKKLSNKQAVTKYLKVKVSKPLSLSLSLSLSLCLSLSLSLSLLVEGVEEN